MSNYNKHAQDGVMMTVSLSPAQLGAALGRQSNLEQAAFLASFLDELRKYCDSCYNAEFQLAAIASELKTEDRELLAMLAPQED